MNVFQKTGLALKTVYSEKKYFFITFLFAFIIYAMNVFVRNFLLLKKQPSITLFLLLISGFHETIHLSGWIVLILVLILGGIVLSMSIHLIKNQVKTNHASGSSGVLLAFIAPACPTCALSIASSAGIGSLLAFLPFNGIELSYLSLILLIISLFYLSNKMMSICEVNPSSA